MHACASVCVCVCVFVDVTKHLENIGDQGTLAIPQISAFLGHPIHSPDSFLSFLSTLPHMKQSKSLLIN